LNPREEIAAFVDEYRRAMPRKVAALEQLLSAGRLAELARELHRLAGSAGTFGLRRLGEAAAAAEAHLLACGQLDSSSDRAQMQRLLETIRHEGSP